MCRMLQNWYFPWFYGLKHYNVCVELHKYGLEMLNIY